VQFVPIDPVAILDAAGVETQVLRDYSEQDNIDGAITHPVLLAKSQVAPRHRHNEWLKFLKKVDSEIAGDLSIHLIVDNYSTHKDQKVRRWLERHPRFHLHFTPTSASWMNMVERFFRDLSQQAILPGSFGSLTELVDAINCYLSQHNLEPKRYVWHANDQEVLDKIRRAWEAATNPPS
jgi:transposase